MLRLLKDIYCAHQLLILAGRAEYPVTIRRDFSFAEDHWQICLRQSNDIYCLGQESNYRAAPIRLGTTHQDFELIVHFTSTIDDDLIRTGLLAHGRDY